MSADETTLPAAPALVGVLAGWHRSGATGVRRLRGVHRLTGDVRGLRAHVTICGRSLVAPQEVTELDGGDADTLCTTCRTRVLRMASRTPGRTWIAPPPSRPHRPATTGRTRPEENTAAARTLRRNEFRNVLGRRRDG